MNILLSTPVLSVGVGSTFEAVCYFVCLFVRSITQKRKIPNTWGYSRSDLVLGLKGQRSRLG